MAGQFSKAQRPSRPGVYFNFTAAAADAVLQSTLGVIALPFDSNWGPENTVVELNSFGDFLATFGTTRGRGYVATAYAFKGEGLPGRGGAATVLAYRMVPSAAAAAAITLQNTTPANALTLTAKYKGTRGNAFKVTTVTASGKTTLTVVGDQGATEVYKYTSTTLSAAVTAINAKSQLLTATLVLDGTALGNVTSSALTGGAAGSVSSTEYTAAMAALEPWRFSLFAVYNTITDGITTSLVSWSQNLNSKGKRFMTVLGGAAGDLIGDPTSPVSGTAVHRSITLCNDPNFLNLGVGTYSDEVFGTQGTAQLAPRLAGILARRGETQSVTFARLAGISIVTGPTESEIITAIENGVVPIARDSHPDAPVRIEKGVTTWVTTSDADRPLSIYSVPKFVRTLHAIETEITEYLEQNVIGNLPVNAATRQFVIGQVSQRLRERESQGAIGPGWTVVVDENPPPAATDDFIALVYSVAMGRSLEQVLNTVVVG